MLESKPERRCETLAESLRDRLIGWRGANHATRVRLLTEFCSAIGMRSLVTNSGALLLAGWVIVGHGAHVWPLAWFVGVAAAGLVPRLYAQHLRQKGQFDTAPERPALIFLAINAGYGLLWGVGALMLIPMLDGAGTAMLLVLIIFGTVMGPYAAMPGILYVRMVTTGVPTLLAIGIYLQAEAFYMSLLAAVWLTVRADVWRGYHRSLTGQMELRQALEEAQESLHASNRQLEVQATSDPVTGVSNRRGLQRELTGLRGPAAVLLFDIDHFKHINDQWGHAVGDEVLVEIVRQTQDVVSGDDLIARYGGDEIAVVLPGRSDAEALSLAERLRRHLDECCLLAAGPSVPVTASIGVASLELGAVIEDPDTILRCADVALYEAKEGGRNRVAQVVTADRSDAQAWA